MVDQDLKAVSSTTGKFVALRLEDRSNAPSGKTGPQNGNELPVVERKVPDMEELAQALNLASRSIGRDLHFEIDMQTGSSVIQVLDRETGELIRQIPPEKTDLYLSDDGALQIRLIDNRV